MSAAVIYWSGTGNTEAMAKAIGNGMKESGIEVDIFPVDEVKLDIIDRYDKLALGCPSMGAEVLEESEFDPFFTSIEGKLAGKKVALFGSYGWGDGEWMRDWYERTKDTGATVYGNEGFIQQEYPNEAACSEFGVGFAGF